MRIGQGFDAHAFAESGDVILGGVKVPYEKGIAAHSDGDVVLHALMDALLGAAALGDIGKHFPDTDQAYHNANSRQLLKEVLSKLQQKKLKPHNVDVTIVAQAPRMSPYIDAMRENIAEDLDLALDYVNVKATTTEKMGFTGRSEGIAVYAVALLNE